MSGGRDNRIRFWDIHTEQPKATFGGNTGQINALAFSTDGRTLASGSRNSTIRLWDVDTGRRTGVLTGHTNAVNALALSPDGRTLASGSEDGTVLLWDFTPFLLHIPGDVNSDGVVNVQDLVLIASNFGQIGVNTADANGDGVVNIQDLVLVALIFHAGLTGIGTFRAAGEVSNLASVECPINSKLYYKGWPPELLSITLRVGFRFIRLPSFKTP